MHPVGLGPGRREAMRKRALNLRLEPGFLLGLSNRLDFGLRIFRFLLVTHDTLNFLLPCVKTTTWPGKRVADVSTRGHPG